MALPLPTRFPTAHRAWRAMLRCAFMLLVVGLSTWLAFGDEPQSGKATQKRGAPPGGKQTAAAANDGESHRAGSNEAASDEAAYETLSLRGRVVYLAPALEKRFGVKGVPEARERILALETPEGEYHPIFEDTRGRAFRKDERLRGIDVEMLARRYRGSPMVQVIKLYALEKGRKYELDYWCQICAIAMYELKPCDCCQGPIELRRRLVEEK